MDMTMESNFNPCLLDAGPHGILPPQFSHKTHEKMAERHSSWLRRFKWLQIILAALTAGGAGRAFR
jgi:hypothetical protein